jgi:hypothetical protein
MANEPGCDLHDKQMKLLFLSNIIWRVTADQRYCYAS